MGKSRTLHLRQKGEIREWDDELEAYSTWVANRFKRYAYIMRVDFQEIVQHARIGAFIASKKFDPSKDGAAKFHTYAYWWMRSVIEREMHNHNRQTRPGPSKTARTNQSIGAFLYNDEGGLINEPEAKAANDGVQSADFIQSIANMVIKKNGERAWEIYRARVLNGMTLDDVGKEHGLSRERIRQICSKVSADLKSRPALSVYNKDTTSIVRKQVHGEVEEKRGDILDLPEPKSLPEIVTPTVFESEFNKLPSADMPWAEAIHGPHGKMYWRALYCVMSGDTTGRASISRWKAKHVAKVMRATEQQKRDAVRVAAWWIAEMLDPDGEHQPVTRAQLRLVI